MGCLERALTGRFVLLAVMTPAAAAAQSGWHNLRYGR